jgi:hypothetical protein
VAFFVFSHNALAARSLVSPSAAGERFEVAPIDYLVPNRGEIIRFSYSYSYSYS